jgi:hypothetical protein
MGPDFLKKWPELSVDIPAYNRIPAQINSCDSPRTDQADQADHASTTSSVTSAPLQHAMPATVQTHAFPTMETMVYVTNPPMYPQNMAYMNGTYEIPWQQTQDFSYGY